jgi:hypothetical protein
MQLVRTTTGGQLAILWRCAGHVRSRSHLCRAVHGDDNKPIRYVSQNRERMFRAPYFVHDPILEFEVLHDEITKIAIVRDNESSTKTWQLHRNDGDW